LIKIQNPDVSEDERDILGEFTRRFCDTQLFWDKYAAGKFADYLFKAKEFVGERQTVSADRAVQLLQEAQLFIDAAHDCHNRMRAAPQIAAGGGRFAQTSGIKPPDITVQTAASRAQTS
jgi:sulfite reductase (ferredoxin)